MRSRYAENTEAVRRDMCQAMKDLGLSGGDPSEESSNRDFFDGYRLDYLYELPRQLRNKPSISACKGERIPQMS